MDTINLENLNQVFQLAGKSAGIILLLTVIVKKVYSFALRKRPVKITKKYGPDGTLLESNEEYRP